MTAVLPHAAATERMRQLPTTLRDYAGFAEAIGALAAGRPASFDGVWGSACALVAAALARATRRGPLVVILPTEREADDAAADLELFTGQRAAVLSRLGNGAGRAAGARRDVRRAAAGAEGAAESGRAEAEVEGQRSEARQAPTPRGLGTVHRRPQRPSQY